MNGNDKLPVFKKFFCYIQLLNINTISTIIHNNEIIYLIP